MSILGFIRNSAEQGLRSANSVRYDMSHRQQALQAVSNMEEFNSQRLTESVRKRADRYARDVFGSKRYAPWLYVYSLVKGSFVDGWIPDNFFGKVVSPRINKSLRVVSDFKTFSKSVLRTDALPDLAYHIDGVLYDRTFAVVSTAELRDMVQAAGGEVFVKSDSSTRGRGVMRVTVQEIGGECFQMTGNCVIQAPIQQHAFFDEIITGSVATVRVTTVKDREGTVGVRATYLRLGRKDTAWVRSDNSVRVAVVGEDGELDSFAYTQDWKRWLMHPDTAFSFGGKRLPRFKELKESCVALHKQIPQFTIIGWDVTVDRNENVKVIEWNSGHCDIKFSESTTGPCFGGLGWERLRA